MFARTPWNGSFRPCSRAHLPWDFGNVSCVRANLPFLRSHGRSAGADTVEKPAGPGCTERALRPSGDGWACTGAMPSPGARDRTHRSLAACGSPRRAGMPVRDFPAGRYRQLKLEELRPDATVRAPPGAAVTVVGVQWHGSDRDPGLPRTQRAGRG
jgi:hypothetical protein